VPGFIIPASLIKPVKRSDALFVSPVLALKSAFPEPFHLVFDFGYFNCLGFNSLKRHRPLFRLRTDLLVEIQSRLARHINRPGISSL
jgi:hypothetical protein